MYATFWALVPPIVAIVLALITKEAYSSLFIGILVGALFQCNFAPVATLDTIPPAHQTVNGRFGGVPFPSPWCLSFCRGVLMAAAPLS